MSGTSSHRYFIGIGGTAMASVAVALSGAGNVVTGSDKSVYPPMSDILRGSGITYEQEFRAYNVIQAAERASRDKAEFEVVVGNAVGRGNPEVEIVLDRKLPHTSLASLVGRELIGTRKSVVIAGTHGKTTTTSLTTWLLETAGRNPGFMVGGVPENFGCGCRKAPEGGVFVTEGDEYDTAFFDKRSKFVHYRPDIAVINNVEFDHADIFDSLADVIKSFRQFVNLVPSSGLLLYNGDDKVAAELSCRAHAPVASFGLGEDCIWRADGIMPDNEGTVFTVYHMGGMFGRFRSPLAGEFNVQNALAAIAACHTLDCSVDEIQKGLDGFLNVKRRMQVLGEPNGVLVIDDFAHHPTAVAATLNALRSRYPGRRLWALFEPRSNTSTRRVHQNEIAQALSIADLVVIGAVNRPERYSADQVFDVTKAIADIEALGREARHEPDPDAMSRFVIRHARPGDVVALLSNGAFGGAHRKILDGLKNLYA
jgi:UDP-N-acetylmuramate: L-alanyl-gamma-D-glutamyl-meso-diaminopimelate ligase